MTTKRGGCLCGDVRYKISGPIGPIGNCHCQTCRRAHAAAFATTARVKARDFKWTAGKETKRAFLSSPDKKRIFCPNCGSHLIAIRDGEDEVILRVGSLYEDPGSKPLVEIWTEQKAPWHELNPNLPSFAEGVIRKKVAHKPDTDCDEP